MINKILDSKIFYIIISILIAVVMWLYVTDDSDDSRVRLTLPVTFVGQETLESQGLMVKDSDEDLTLTFTGRRSVVQQLDKSNVKLQADVSKLTAGTQTIKCTVVYPTNVQSSSVTVDQSTLNIDVTVVKMTTKTVEVKAIFSGSVAEDYWAGVGMITCSPETIEVSGEAQFLELVDHAEVTIDTQNITTNVSENLPITLVDAEGNLVESDSFRLSQDTALVTMPVGYIREIPLTVEFINGGGATNANVTYEIEPKSITLAGDKDLLDPYVSIALDPIDLSQVVTTATFERTIPISSELTNLSNVTTATVTVTVSGLSTRTMDVDASRIQFDNIPAGCTPEALNQSVSILLRGTQDSLDLVMENNIRIVADLENLTATAGRYTVDAKVYVDGFDDVGAVGEYTIYVKLTR